MYTKYSLPCLPHLWIHQILTSLASLTCGYTKYSPPLPPSPVDTPNTHLPHLSVHQILTSLTCQYTKYSPPSPVNTPNTHLPCLTHLSIHQILTLPTSGSTKYLPPLPPSPVGTTNTHCLASLGLSLPLLPSCRHVVLDPSVHTRVYVGSSFATYVALWYHSVGWSLLTFPSACFHL